MLTLLLTIFFIAAAILVIGSLADSMVRGCNAWRTINREMTAQLSQDMVQLQADVIAFNDMQPYRSRHLARARASVTEQLAAAA